MYRSTQTSLPGAFQVALSMNNGLGILPRFTSKNSPRILMLEIRSDSVVFFGQKPWWNYRADVVPLTQPLTDTEFGAFPGVAEKHTSLVRATREGNIDEFLCEHNNVARIVKIRRAFATHWYREVPLTI